MIPQDTQAKLDFYIEAYEAARRRVNDDHTAVAIVQELGKDLRCNGAKQHESSNNQPASLKQIEYLKKLNVPIHAELTKREASALIDEALARDY